jgi:predicted dehydrogenase
LGFIGRMLSDAADLVATRQISRKKPRTYRDYREMLKEKDLDIVLVGTPDHWHALTMIAALEAGADVYVQKPISVDVLEGKAMLAAARKLNRVVQVGTQRRSTPHLIEARDNIVKAGKLGTVALVEICCYYHMRTQDNPPDTDPPANLDYEMWTGPAPMRPYNRLVHPRGWRAFMEYGNGIIGDMAIHMFDMTRWMLDLDWPKTIQSSGGILVDKNSKANISDTQSAVFDYGNLQVVWQHRTWGEAPDPKYPWAATSMATREPSKPAFTVMILSPPAMASRSIAMSLTNWINIPRTGPKKTLKNNALRPLAGTCGIFSPAFKAVAGRWRTSSRGTFPPLPAFWPTFPCNWGARCAGTARPARWLETRKPMPCCAVPIGRPGRTRKRTRPEPERTTQEKVENNQKWRSQSSGCDMIAPELEDKARPIRAEK